MRSSCWFVLFLTFGPLFSLSAQEDIYDLDQVLEIKMYFPQSNWEYLLDSLKQVGEDDRLKGNIEINGKKYEGVGVRYKGNSSYFNVRKKGSSKLPFNIKLDYKKKKHQLAGGVTKLKLANVFRDPSFLREVLSYNIARKYMPAPRANFAKVYINDQYLGIYNNTESIDKTFLTAQFNQNEGTLLKCDPNWHVKVDPNCPKGDKASLMYLGDDPACYMASYELQSDDEAGWQDLIYLTKVLNQNPDSLDQIFNVNQALWMLAFNMVLVNLDSYTGRLCHNYYVYKDTFGYYHPMVWDMNLSFGGFRFLGLEGRPLSNQEMQELSPFVHYKERNKKRPLITQLLRNNLYRKIYLAHIRTILEENFVEGQYIEDAENIKQRIDELIKLDDNKLYDYEAFKSNLEVSTKADKQSIIGIQELMAKRSEYLLNHPVMKHPVPFIDKAEHLAFADEYAINASIEGAQKAWVFYRNDPNALFQKVELFDDGSHNDQKATDGIWGVNLKAVEGTQYYIVAEGKTEASLSPRRAGLAYYTIGKNLNE